MPTNTSHLLLTLTRMYCEDERYYHNLKHIAAMLDEGARHHISDDQVWAVWFHDAIYDVHAKDNEFQSAALARRELAKLDYPKDGIARIEQIVLDTTDHLPTISESELVLDLDLAWLSLPWSTYEQLVAEIRKEYAFATDEQWREGRPKVLRHLLERDAFYFTPAFKTREDAARENLRREIIQLEA